jgi:hypothetical protein
LFIRPCTFALGQVNESGFLASSKFLAGRLPYCSSANNASYTRARLVRFGCPFAVRGAA